MYEPVTVTLEKILTPFQLRWTYPSKWFGVFFKCEVGGPPLLEQWRQHICWLAPGSWSLWQQACKPLRYGSYLGNLSQICLVPDHKKTRVETAQRCVEIFQALQQEPVDFKSKAFISKRGRKWVCCLHENNRRPLIVGQLCWETDELLHNSAGTFSTFQRAMDTPGHQGGHDWWHMC